MFVGESGVMRIVERACQIMREHDTDDVRKYGGIDLETIQRGINFHFSVSLDLFGQEVSTNAANYYTESLKGRFNEGKIDDDHKLVDATWPVIERQNGGFVEVQKPALIAVNERLRQDYINDCQRGVTRWNKVIKKYGIDFELKLPHRAFNRRIGAFAGLHVSPEGNLMSEADWKEGMKHWVLTEADRAYVTSIMGAVSEPGKWANWIAPPARGINGQPLDFEYVRLG